MASHKRLIFTERNEDIVHALWRHRDIHEQGSRIGRCGWITSFLRRHLPASSGMQRFYLTLYPAKSNAQALDLGEYLRRLIHSLSRSLAVNIAKAQNCRRKSAKYFCVFAVNYQLWVPFLRFCNTGPQLSWLERPADNGEVSGLIPLGPTMSPSLSSSQQVEFSLGFMAQPLT